MAHMGRPGLSAVQEAELWERRKYGESLRDIGRALGKHARWVFVFDVFAEHESLELWLKAHERREMDLLRPWQQRGCPHSSRRRRFS